MKADNRSQNNKVAKAIDGMLEEQYSTDLKVLIDAVPDEDGKLPKKVILAWSELVNEMSSAFSDRDLEKSISLLSYQIACLHRKIINDDSRNRLFIGWCRYAASLRHYKATFDLCLIALDRQLNDEVIRFWSDQTIELLVEELDCCYDRVKKESLLHQANLIIRRVSYNSPQIGLTLAFKVMQAPGLTKTKGGEKLANIANEITEKMGGIRVLESIEPSGDRSVRNVCDRYEELVKNPVSLIGIACLDTVQKKLDQEFPWFNELTKKLISSLRVRQLGSGNFKVYPILVLGDYGIGKTSYTLRFSELMQVPFRAISLAGKNDNRDIAGTARGWGTGHPSMMIQLMNEYKIGNPVVLVDEIDKCGGSDHNGRALDTLLTLFEPTSAKKFYDEYLCGNCDFSNITWLCTANSVAKLPGALLSRLDVVTVSKPALEDYPAIVNRSIATFFEENGIHAAHTPILNEADWKWLERYYTSPRVTKRAVYKWLAHTLLTPKSALN